MANHASSKKRIRRNGRHTVINGTRRSRIRTFIKKVEKAIDEGDASAAEESFKAAKPEIQRGIAKGVMHKNAAARKMSRLSARVKALKEAS